MAGLRCETKKYTNAFAIQMIELILVHLFLIISFAIAGRLVYNDFFPCRFANSFLSYLAATAIAVIVLTTVKYFNYFNVSFLSIAGKAALAVLISNLALINFLYFSTDFKLSMFYFMVVGVVQIFLLLLIKILTRRQKFIIINGRISLIIGSKKNKDEMINVLKKQGINKINFVSISEINLNEYIDRADDIYLMDSKSMEIKSSVIAYCALKNKTLFLVPEINEIAMKNSEMTKIHDLPLFNIGCFQLSETQMVLKRVMDIIISLIGILLSLPILLVVAICIKIEDGGPVFYRQVRSGLNRKEFSLIKLRSMVVDAEKNTGPVLASEDDERITRIGCRLRSTRIDEIPQFFNVLTGSMSIVGPRPERPVFVEKYTEEIPYYTHRFTVKPGITGFAQVMGNYATTTENKLRFDLIYIVQYSPLKDIIIILKTAKTVFSKEQSAGVRSTKNKIPSAN